MFKLRHVLLSLSLILFCASLFTTLPAYADKDEEVVLEPIPKGWKQHTVTEPVFNSKVFVVETGRQNANTLLFVHGLGYTGLRDWFTVIPEVTSRYHVLALDLPGFGLSEAPQGQYSPTNYARLLSWLVRTYANNNKAIVAGHSLGAAVSLRFAANYPEQVDKLILADTAGILERTAFIKHQAELPIEFKHAPSFLVKTASRIQDFSSSIVEQVGVIPEPPLFLYNNPVAWNFLMKDKPTMNAGFALIEENFSSAIETVPHDTHLIWGEGDNVAPLRTGKLLEHRLQKTSLSVIPGAKHIPMKTHARQFNHFFQQALNSAPLLHRSDSQPAPGIKLPNLSCKGKTNVTYRGHYNRIKIHKCTAVTLEDVTANFLEIKKSLIELYNVNITSEGTALKTVESVIVATASSFSGKTAIESKDSRLDFAGVSINGSQHALLCKTKSKVIFSVSHIESPIYKGSLHDMYKVKKTTLDELLTEK